MHAQAPVPTAPHAPKISLQEAEQILDPRSTPTWELVEQARRLRSAAFGDHAHLCMILNAKSGSCTEDCAFCSQSRHHRCQVPVYPLVSREHALEKAREAERAGARCFGLVTSGRQIRGKRERARILDMVEFLRRNTLVEIGLSPGLADPGFLRDLQRAGLNTFHHNLETAPGFYEYICTTHPFEQRLRTVRDASEAGLRVCSGGIFGLGETYRHRAEMTMLWKDLPIDRIPVNFLNPIPGTALETMQRIEPLEALHILAALRILIPDREILVCGGRDAVLRGLQPYLFSAGANGIMTGNYLTTPGQGVEKDQEMIEDLGLKWRPPRM